LFSEPLHQATLTMNTPFAWESTYRHQAFERCYACNPFGGLIILEVIGSCVYFIEALP
jgi:hypothetical protein